MMDIVKEILLGFAALIAVVAFFWIVCFVPRAVFTGVFLCSFVILASYSVGCAFRDD